MLDEHQSKEPNKQQRVMKKSNLETMSVDDLWSLHEEISGILSARITSEKRERNVCQFSIVAATRSNAGMRLRP
jgi:hypothetical protein